MLWVDDFFGAAIIRLYPHPNRFWVGWMISANVRDHSNHFALNRSDLGLHASQTGVGSFEPSCMDAVTFGQVMVGHAFERTTPRAEGYRD